MRKAFYFLGNFIILRVNVFLDCWLAGRFEDYLRLCWRARWVSKRIYLAEVVDITPLIDFASSILKEFLIENFFKIDKEVDSLIKDSFKSIMGSLLDKEHVLSEDRFIEIGKEAMNMLLPSLEAKRLEGGVKVTSSFEEVKTIIGTEMRYRIMKALAEGPKTAKELSKAMPDVREEAIRRAVEQMVKIKVLELKSRISGGRAVKEYRLKTPMLIIDLRPSPPPRPLGEP